MHKKQVHKKYICFCLLVSLIIIFSFGIINNTFGDSSCTHSWSSWFPDSVAGRSYRTCSKCGEREITYASNPNQTKTPMPTGLSALKITIVGGEMVDLKGNKTSGVVIKWRAYEGNVDVTNQNFSIVSEKSHVVAVSGQTLTAKAPGIAKVKFTKGALKASVTITVIDSGSDEIGSGNSQTSDTSSNSGISGDSSVSNPPSGGNQTSDNDHRFPTEKDIVIGDSFYFSDWNPDLSDPSEQILQDSWETSDNKIATVSGGTVKALKLGHCTISCRTKSGKVFYIDLNVVGKNGETSNEGEVIPPELRFNTLTPPPITNVPPKVTSTPTPRPTSTPTPSPEPEELDLDGWRVVPSGLVVGEGGTDQITVSRRDKRAFNNNLLSYNIVEDDYKNCITISKSGSIFTVTGRKLPEDMNEIKINVMFKYKGAPIGNTKVYLSNGKANPSIEYRVEPTSMNVDLKGQKSVTRDLQIIKSVDGVEKIVSPNDNNFTFANTKGISYRKSGNKLVLTISRDALESANPLITLRVNGLPQAGTTCYINVTDSTIEPKVSAAAPTVTPSTRPSVTPSTRPSVTPSTRPSVTPSARPSVTPSVGPSVTPSAKPSVTPTVTVGVSLRYPKIKMKIGEKQMATLLYNPTNATGVIVESFESDNPSVVSVDTKGNITAKSVGRAKITVTIRQGDIKNTGFYSIIVENSPNATATLSPEPTKGPTVAPTAAPSISPSSSAKPTATPTEEPTDKVKYSFSESRIEVNTGLNYSFDYPLTIRKTVDGKTTDVSPNDFEITVPKEIPHKIEGNKLIITIDISKIGTKKTISAKAKDGTGNSFKCDIEVSNGSSSKSSTTPKVTGTDKPTSSTSAKPTASASAKPTSTKRRRQWRRRRRKSNKRPYISSYGSSDSDSVFNTFCDTYTRSCCSKPNSCKDDCSIVYTTNEI